MKLLETRAGLTVSALQVGGGGDSLNKLCPGTRDRTFLSLFSNNAVPHSPIHGFSFLCYSCGLRDLIELRSLLFQTLLKVWGKKNWEWGMNCNIAFLFSMSYGPSLTFVLYRKCGLMLLGITHLFPFLFYFSLSASKFIISSLSPFLSSHPVPCLCLFTVSHLE